jgi:hypothetical protein
MAPMLGRRGYGTEDRALSARRSGFREIAPRNVWRLKEGKVGREDRGSSVSKMGTEELARRQIR